MAYNGKLVKNLLPILRYVEGLRIRRKIKILKGVHIVKPIFIVGVPRSGTTLLYRTLCMHPEVGWFSHLDLHNWMTDERKKFITNYYTKQKQQKKKIPNSEETMVVFGTKQTLIEGTTGLPIEAATFWQSFLDYAGKNISEGLKDKIKTVIYNILKIQNKSRFVNKSLYMNMRLSELNQIFPDAKFINIVRDPREVISSAMERYKKEGYFDFGISNKNKSKLNADDFIQQSSFAYKEIINTIFKFSLQVKRDNFMTIKYEELYSNPKEVVLNILQFCELEIPTSIEDIVPKIRETRKKWVENLTIIDQKRIFDILKPSLQKMNYQYEL